MSRCVSATLLRLRKGAVPQGYFRAAGTGAGVYRCYARHAAYIYCGFGTRNRQGEFPGSGIRVRGTQARQALLDNYTDIHFKRFCPGRKIVGGIIGRRRKIASPSFPSPLQLRSAAASVVPKAVIRPRGPRRLPPSPVR